MSIWNLPELCGNCCSMADVASCLVILVVLLHTTSIVQAVGVGPIWWPEAADEAITGLLERLIWHTFDIVGAEP